MFKDAGYLGSGRFPSYNSNYYQRNFFNTVPGIVSYWANKTPDSIAIMAPNKPHLNYTQLFSQIQYIVEYLNGIGIGRYNRVVTVLPNGPNMAVAFLGISSCATCAPLNPAYTSKEFEFYLSDLRADLIITQSGMETAVTEVAERQGIKTINLEPVNQQEAGIFTLTSKTGAARSSPVFIGSSEVALILHTSGTTSRPKIVPLTHLNICASARNIQQTLRLTQNDRCLNIMPLFHIHGLIGATLASMSAGASIVCSPGFLIKNFFQWLDEFQPTWYTAVPTMHQMILHNSGKYEDIVQRCRLRFIRSSSSALPPKVMVELECRFKTPVIESYGMTEASHQMSSNQLSPLTRKVGTVGIPAGPEITILDDYGNIMEKGEIGEIAIKGQNVMKGYENNYEANSKAFSNGWFRTGDQGYFDEDNFLVIKDRIKEIINRGGEKISPREIDEVILNHPSVRQVVTFAVPDPLLGEEVGAAVVLKENKDESEWEIQEFVSKFLSDFKVPRYVIFLNEIPKGPTGKLQRIGLADRLGVSQREFKKQTSEYNPPKTTIEKKLELIWSEALDVEKLSITDNFFHLGGDSIIAGQILATVSEEFNIKRPPLVIFLRAPTIEKMAQIIGQNDFDLGQASLVAIQHKGIKPPIYCVHDCYGEVLFLSHLAQSLGDNQPLYGLRAQGIEGKQQSYTNVSDMAKHYLKEIESFQPNEPYIFAGAGIGGLIALEMAQELGSKNKKLDKLILFDMAAFLNNQIAEDELPLFTPKLVFHQFIYRIKRFEMKQIIKWIIEWAKRNSRESARIIYWKIAGKFRTRIRILNEINKAGEEYELKDYSGHTILFVGIEGTAQVESRVNYWKKNLKGKFDVHVIPGMHLDILQPPNVNILADLLKKHLDE